MSLHGHSYTLCYCEENIYALASHHPDSFVVFISSEARAVPFWRNKLHISEENPEGFIVWDYHVILVDKDRVWDFDSAVEFPCSLGQYLQSVLRTHLRQPEQRQYQRLYRVIKAADYRKEFASDRTHMLNEEGKYNSPVPSYPAIKSKSGEVMNLDKLITLTQLEVKAYETDLQISTLHGVVLNEESFVRFASGLSVDRD